MAYHYGDTLRVEDYLMLRAAVGWAAIPADQAEAGLRNTRLLVACMDDHRVIGCARLVWDGGYIAYLADVMVLPEAQGHGVGKALVTRLLDHLRAEMKPGWTIKVPLMAAKGREPFYERLGFHVRPNEGDGAGMERKLIWEREG